LKHLPLGFGSAHKGVTGGGGGCMTLLLHDATAACRYCCMTLLLHDTAMTAPHRYGPTTLQQQQLFNYSPSQPFKPGSGWLSWGLIGLAAAPLVVGAAAVALTAVGYESAVAGGRGTVDGVAGMISMDGPTYARLLAVTGTQLLNSQEELQHDVMSVHVCLLGGDVI
jgi:hypothetical protein